MLNNLFLLLLSSFAYQNLSLDNAEQKLGGNGPSLG